MCKPTIKDDPRSPWKSCRIGQERIQRRGVIRGSAAADLQAGCHHAVRYAAVLRGVQDICANLRYCAHYRGPAAYMAVMSVGESTRL